MSNVTPMIPRDDDADQTMAFLDRVEACFLADSGLPRDVLTRAMMVKACNGLIDDLGANAAAELLVALASRIATTPQAGHA